MSIAAGKDIRVCEVYPSGNAYESSVKIVFQETYAADPSIRKIESFGKSKPKNVIKFPIKISNKFFLYYIQFQKRNFVEILFVHYQINIQFIYSIIFYNPIQNI